MTAADLLTLARAGFSLPALLAFLSGRGRRWAFWASLIGSTLLDWLDGPLARRIGSTSWGAVLDIEVDSWLTLSTAFAGVRLGRLPRFCAVPPMVRYLLTPGEAGDLRLWHRAVGWAQMAVLIGALSRRSLPARFELAVSALQLVVLLDVARRRARFRRRS